MSQPKLLAIDDVQTVLTMVRKVAEKIGYRVEATLNPEQFKNLLESFIPDLILMDVMMPDQDGLQLLRYAANKQVTAPILLISDYGAQLLNIVEKMGFALGLDIRAIEKPLGPISWQELLASEKTRSNAQRRSEIL